MPNLFIFNTIRTTAISGIFLVFFSQQIQAAELSVDVLDTSGSPIENAVVYAEPDNKSS